MRTQFKEDVFLVPGGILFLSLFFAQERLAKPNARYPNSSKSFELLFFK